MSRICEYRNCRDCDVTTSGTTAATTSANGAPTRGVMADHPVAPERLGDRACPGREARTAHACRATGCGPKTTSDGDEHGHEQQRIDEPGIGRVVVEDHRLDHAQHDSRTERDRHRRHAGDHRDRQRAQQDAGPELTPVDATLALASGALRIVATAASPPASDQTTNETRFVLIPDSRAASGLSAAARTAVPCFVRFRNQARPPTSDGKARRGRSRARSG